MTFKIFSIGCALFCSTTAFAQNKPTFDKTTADLGSVVWKSHASATFKIKNPTDKPLVISRIETSCECTVADWTHGAIMPGEEGEIKATIDAAMMGHFTKFIDVYYGSEKEPVTLTMQGNVVYEIANKEAIMRNYPFEIGEIAMSGRTIDFGNIQKGESKSVFIDIRNNGKVSYEPIIMHLPNYVTLEATPSRVSSGRTSQLKITFDSKKYSGRLGWANSKVYLSRFLGDKVGDDNELQLSATIVPDFSNLTPVQKLNPPVLEVSTDSVVISRSQKKKGISALLSKSVGTQVEIANTGKGTLEIKQVSVAGTAVSVSLSSVTVLPGETAHLNIELNTKNIKKQSVQPAVLLVTNDPSRPAQTIKVTIIK